MLEMYDRLTRDQHALVRTLIVLVAALRRRLGLPDLQCPRGRRGGLFRIRPLVAFCAVLWGEAQIIDLFCLSV
ncbi:hypothetical protein D3C81_1607960 [compost metagenome]